MGLKLRHLKRAAEFGCARQGTAHVYLAIERSIEGTEAAFEHGIQARVGHIRETCLGVDGIIAAELHAAIAFDRGAGEVRIEGEGEFFATGLGGGGEISERLLIEFQTAGADVGIQGREERGGILAQCGRAIGDDFDHSAEPLPGLLYGMQAGELNLVGAHMERGLAFLEIARGVIERRG